MNQYLENFGILKINKALNLNDKVEDLFDDASESLIGRSIRNTGDAVPVVVAGVEKNPRLANYLISSGILNVADMAFGKNNYLFWGSDLSTFNSSSNWHRDICNDIPFWKIGIYLDGAYNMDQTFLYIPGSHHVSDIYSRSLGKGLHWPEGAGLNPIYFKNELNFNNNEGIGHNVPNIPITISRGDIIVFDTRGIHAVASNTKRRLIALSFIPKPILAGYLANGFIRSEVEYMELILKIRCASQLMEEYHGRTVKYGQKNLNVPIELYELMPFKHYNDEDIQNLMKIFFKENDYKAAMKLINKY
jgi:hypothetical protein